MSDDRQAVSEQSSCLLPAERIALTVAKAQVERGDNPPINTTTVLVMALERLTTERERVVTTPYDDPIVQMCIDAGGHFWPEDAPADEPATCTRCWFNPGWKAGKPRDEQSVRPITDDPRGGL